MEDKRTAPVVVFAYNRKDHIENCLNALDKNQMANQSELFIFADGAKSEAGRAKVDEVRTYLHEYAKSSSFKKVSIIEAEKNKGLANSIIGGVSEITGKYGKVIVVEDDLIVHDNFLVYMNQALDYYENDMEIGSISAYTYPIKFPKDYNHDVYVIRKGECWGWATWDNRWSQVDWSVSDYEQYKNNKKMRREFCKLEKALDAMLVAQMEGRLDSWVVRWCYHLFKNKQLTVYPRESMLSNDGFDGSGTHCGEKTRKEDDNEKGLQTYKFENVPINKVIEKRVSIYESGTFWDWVIVILKKYSKIIFNLK